MKATKAKPLALAVLPSTGLDQPTPLPDLDRLIGLIEQGVSEAARQHNPDLALGLIHDLVRVSDTAGIALARALWLTRQQWAQIKGQKFETPELAAENFAQEVFLGTGKSADTLRRYLLTWEMYEQPTAKIPPPVKKVLQERPIGDQIALAQAVKEHGAFTPKQWKELAQAEDQAHLRKLVRGYTGREDAAVLLTIKLKNDGTLVAYEGSASKPVILGLLRNREDDLRDPVRSKAIARLIRRARIQDE